MPNLLKSLPREILSDEDKQFIYNILNPLLFEKIRETPDEIRKVFKVSELLEKDIYRYEQFDYNFRIPYNIDSRSFHVYMSDGQKKVKLENYKNQELVRQLDEIKEFIFFYFGVKGYEFIRKIIEKYYYLINEVEKNYNLYKINYDKYLVAVDVKKKKIYKTTFEYFKKLYDKYNLLLIEFKSIFKELERYNDYSISQLLDNIARTISDIYKLKTFDNEIIFEKSELFKYLSNNIIIPQNVNKYTFSGKKIIDSIEFNPRNVFELMAIFAMELSEIKNKYDEYLKILTDNHGMGYSLKRSEYRLLKNNIISNIKLDLNSDNLTYFIDEENNKLEIYLYFDQEFRIEENSLKIFINDIEFNKSIISNNGYIHRGYTIFDYFDEYTKYYKITIHDYLIKDLDGEYLNYDIENIEINFNAVQAIHHKLENTQEPILETTSFLDNFIIYRKNEETGFYERFDIPYKIKIDIDEKEERYTRIYEFLGIDADSHQALINNSEIIISCYAFDYVYEPKIYVDFFKDLSNEVEFRYHTIIQYVLIDDLMGKDIEIPYYEKLDLLSYNSNINKNVLMFNNHVYKRLYDNLEFMYILNPYNETNNTYVSKITYKQLLERDHVRDTIITEMIEKLPFYKNLKYLEPYQYDEERDCLIFFYNNKQYILPLNENLNRGKNYEKVSYDRIARKIFYCGIEKCEQDFNFINEKIYILNSETGQFDEMELVPTEMINLTETKNKIFYDTFTNKHTIIIKGKKYNISNLYLADDDEALKYEGINLIYVNKKFGIPRLKTANGEIIDIDFSNEILINETPYDGSFVFDEKNKKLIYYNSIIGQYIFDLEESDDFKNYHRLVGLTINSLFYVGNTLPDNSNKLYYGRENIMNSLDLLNEIYDIGKAEDKFNNSLQHKLLAEQLDLNIDNAKNYNMEEEPYIMFKSRTASLKGLESYLKSNLKSLSQNLKISPVYLVQRNRFISEWARLSSVLPNNEFAADALKDLVADLMETKLINGKYDDLIDIFKSNEHEKFSLKTNDIHGILVQYIRRYLEEESLLEKFNYYLIHEVWIANNRKKIIDYIKSVADEKTIKIISTMTFKINQEKEKLFYIFMNELEKERKVSIESYKPIANYSDWIDYQENNHVKFEKPFKYDLIDISDFITMSIDWKQPILLIRPLTDDGVFTTRDYRFLDMSIATNSQITYNDAYNEYVEEIKNKLNKPVDYLEETLKIMYELSLENEFDFLGINLVIVRWIVERFLPNYLINNKIETVEEFREAIRDELLSAEHPNLIVSYNKIKESTYLKDLGTNIKEIYDSIIAGNLVTNSFIRLNITDQSELEYLDKIKKPIEHYFDFLFNIKRYDIVAKVLALFTEDVIASSMLDLSLAINIKNSKGDETFDIYEKTILNIFEEFLPFHSVLDKIIFSIKIMESSSAEAISKQVDAEVTDTTIIDIVSKFIEKVRIQINSNLVLIRGHQLTSSPGLLLSGPHDEIPYDFDRKIKPGGHSIISPYIDDFETYGVDDKWYVIDTEKWKKRAEDDRPPSFVDYWWSDSVDLSEDNGAFEKAVETCLDDYFHIKQNIFERDDRIESHFIDIIPSIDIGYEIDENPNIDLAEDYLINIDSIFNIKFYDLETLPHDEFGLDETRSPDNQTTLIDAREDFYQKIIHEFHEKIIVSVLDSIWTDIKVLYDMPDIPGHDEFGIDEYYHQRGPDTLGREISTMIYDELLQQGFEITAVDMSDISIIDNKLATKVISDKKLLADVRVSEDVQVNIKIWAGRKTLKFLTPDGTFIPPGHDEFGYDEFYHNSAYLDRITNMVDLSIQDALGTVRIDFGFMRMLPIDPYADLINQKFYRADQPGSEWQKTKIRDTLITNIRIFGKDVIRIFTLDSFAVDIINEKLRRKVYSDIENDVLNGDYFAASLTDTFVKRHIHHDFRENIVALEKYANVLDDETILEIFGLRAIEIERDKLYEVRIGDKIYNDIKLKLPVERTLTKFDKDYIKEIKIEEPNFVEYKHIEYDLDVRFSEHLKMYYNYQAKASAIINETAKAIIKQMHEKEKIETTIFDKIQYGHHHSFEIDGMTISLSDKLIELWQNKIYSDSLVTTVTDINELKTTIDFEYEFKEERILQPHDLYGHMGYTDETLQRSIDSRLTDSLITISKDLHVDESYIETYDKLMHDVHYYFGDYLEIEISESMHTYVNIVKKPWIFPEFDEFGHDEYPHMYHGESDEFDITTKLRDQLKIDANAFLYNAGALVEFNEKLLAEEHLDLDKDSISVSLVDDLKVVSIRFKDNINILTSDITKFEKEFYEQQNIVVQDVVWYGYKLRDNWIQIETTDNVNYGYNEATIKDNFINTTIRDWILTEYGLYDSKIEINLSDMISNFKTGILTFDETSITFEETLNIDEHRKVYLRDDSKVNTSITDAIHIEDYGDTIVGVKIKQYDKTNVSITDKLEYGHGKWFHEQVRGYILNRLSIYDGDLVYPPDLMIKLSDNFQEYTKIKPFKDKLIINTYERMKYGLIFRDTLNVELLRDDYLIIGRRWDVNRYGVDDIIHDKFGYGMEYPDDISADGSFAVSFSEDIKIISEYVFKDTLNILPQDRIGSSDGEKTSDFNITKTDDGIVITSSDNLLYGIGSYDYIWDAKEWEYHGYEIPYEKWTGHVPHDDFPYDEMQHQDQGDDLSQIVTGVSDNLLYGFDFLFKDTVQVQINDIGGFETWEYQSLFKDSTIVWIDNRLGVNWADVNDKKTLIEIRKEQMLVSYEFEDKIKEHIFKKINDVDQELINIYDIETYQLIEQIFKYKLYDRLDTEINSNLFNSSLFKYDDVISLATDWKTKINLYKEQADGSITKTMTLIKDKTSAKVELIFGDIINTNMKDYLHATLAERPDEYLE